MNAHATVIIVYATMCAFLSCFAICIVKTFVSMGKMHKMSSSTVSSFSFHISVR